MKSSIIVNPASGGGRTASMWKTIRGEVRSRLGELEEFVTQSTGDATRFASDIATHDSKLLIIAGGDGTINEVVNGLYNEENEPINPDLKIGILSTGRGCDFIRSVGIPPNYREAVDLLVNPIFKKVDVGCAFFKDEFGREQRRLFINVASAGLAGVVAKKVNHTPRFLPPGLAYFGNAAATFLTARGQLMKVTVDGKPTFEGPCMNVFIANGSYSGAGMCWAPMAKVDDGLFDIVISEPLPKYRIVMSGHRLYDGTFIHMPGVHHYQGREVLIETDDDVLLEMDGEQPGVAPAVYKLLPKSLTLAVGS
jgi:diacylglycerol kinase (ATP)